ncbi:hypothetical protein AAFF_G00328750 [Aldrovandia affinis]|uniref:Uncharacterized protein n=1 Tax=Aldrovandia affinis TaxID=143900 RepID=A0AAD7WQT3_9TELE|nr:hypothetical protein AAFF_G00328750 [Aldrovandia affinis]
MSSIKTCTRRRNEPDYRPAGPRKREGPRHREGQVDSPDRRLTPARGYRGRSQQPKHGEAETAATPCQTTVGCACEAAGIPAVRDEHQSPGVQEGSQSQQLAV